MGLELPRLEQLKVMFLELDTDGSGWTKDVLDVWSVA